MQNIHGFMVYSFNTFPYHGCKDELEMRTEGCKTQGERRELQGLLAGGFSIM